MTKYPARLSDDEEPKYRNKKNKAQFIHRGETASVKDYDLDACPPGYDDKIWDLVIAFRDAALELDFRLRTNNRLAYALLQTRIEESRIREVVEDGSLGPATAQIPTWSRIVRLMMLLFWSDYVTIKREAFAWEQFCGDVTVWEDCMKEVVREAIAQKIIEEDPEEPGEPRRRSPRKLRKARPRTATARKLEGFVPQVDPALHDPEGAHRLREFVARTRGNREDN